MEVKKPSLLVSLSPIIFLISLLIVNILIFKDDATGGPNQVALFLSAIFASAVGVIHLKLPYKMIEKGMISSMSLSLQAALILLMVGALIGVWIMSGIVPAMVYYGLKLIAPSIFLPFSCLICVIVSLATGSSWSTTGTIGVALIGIGTALGIPEGMVAGAIISGAYFGDKMSPMSDTTNLAPAMAGTELFVHIRHMMYTSIPSILIALVGFTILGFLYSNNSGNDFESISLVTQTIKEQFYISPALFFAPAVVLFLVIAKIDALPALFIGTSLGVLTILIFQTDILLASKGASGIYQEILKVSYSGYSLESGNKVVDTLFSRGGMSGMLSTIWLILMAMAFGGSLEATGMLDVMANKILSFVKGAGSLVGSTIATCIVMNATASDQYLAIVVPGRMFKKAYQKYGLHFKNLSRALEDAGTVTSVLIPWNSGGAYNASVLGVSTLTYLPYCFFNILSPIISIFLASMNWTIEREAQGELEE